MAKHITNPAVESVSADDLLSSLLAPTRTTGGAGGTRQRSSHGYHVFKAFLESGAAQQKLTYANEDDAKAARLSLTKECDLLNAEREPLDQLWVSPRQGNVITLVDLGKTNNAQVQAAILRQLLNQQQGVAARMTAKFGRTHDSVKAANAKAKAYSAALEELDK